MYPWVGERSDYARSNGKRLLHLEFVLRKKDKLSLNYYLRVNK